MNIKKKKKKWPWVLLAIIAALVLLVTTFLGNRPNMRDSVSYENYTVSRGSITSTITGSGKLESVDTKNIEVANGVTVSEILVKVGDGVTAGETLATLDADSLKDRTAYITGELSSLDNELARLNSSKTTDYVYASVKGRIKHLPVSKGSDVISSIAEFGSLALISTDGLMKVEIASTLDLNISSKVTVKWQDGSETGKVAAKTDDGYLITLDDAKAPYNEIVQVISEDALLGEGIANINAPVTIFANGGTISKVHCALNDKVSARSKLFTLDNEPFSSGYQQKFSERTDMAKQLETVMMFLNNPQITAIEDGVISKINITEGNKTGADSSIGESTAIVINTGGAVRMIVSVDELDSLSVSLEQQATVTLDAFSSEKFFGKVTHVSRIGNTDKSITTFAVELTLSPDTRLLEGMNGNATILVDQVDDVLIIPVEAINEDSSGAFVYVGANREKVYIKTGLSDGKHAEVTNGISEGDVILYISSSASSTNNQFGGMPNPFGGRMGGGAIGNR